MISIIITAFNNDKYIDECLYSIVDSFKDYEYEILLGIDNCEITTNHILKNFKGHSKNIKFYFFKERYGTYVIRNTLAKETKYENLLFFDSDDVMLPIMAKLLVKYYPHFDMIKPMLSQFKDKYDLNDTKLLSQKSTFGEGVFGIKKSLFFEMNGFEPWVCAADSEFNWRVICNSKRIKHVEQVCFLYRRHSESLTNSNDTNPRSKLRHYYHMITKNKKIKNECQPIPKLVIGEFLILNEYSDEDLEIIYKTGINDISEITLYRELKEKSKYALGSVFNKSPRKTVHKIINKEEKIIKEINKDTINSILNRDINTPKILTPQPKTPQLNNNTNSNRDTLQRLFLSKKLNKSDSSYMNIGRKINK
jgi:glycosyltransferase involved in cell wall biosynthesis